MTKKYDVAVYGATGFVGKLCIQHLVSHPQFTSGDFTWAIAGRSATKLQSVKRDFNLPESVGIIEADNTHEEKLSQLASSSRVVLNLVGPYSQYGSFRLAELCVEHRTHYTDLSGESLYNQQLVQKLHQKAQKTGVVLAASVGYDSLPPDLTTFLAVKALRELQIKKKISTLKHIQAFSAHAIKGGASGGTVASLRHMASTAPWQVTAMKPNAMGEGIATSKNNYAIHDPATFYLPHVNQYGFRSPFALHNTRTVYHSATLTDDNVYGNSFQHIDLLVASPKSNIPIYATLVIGTMVSFILKSIFFLMRTSSLFRKFTEKYIPVGTGPTPYSQRTGFALVRTLVSGFDETTTLSSNGHTPKIATIAQWKAEKADPGYLMTSRVICEVSLLLALKSKRGEIVTPGVRTGATIDPDALVQRLTQYAKVQIDVTEAQTYRQTLLVGE